MNMATITISVDDKIEELFRKEVVEHIGEGKGTLGKAITEAMNLWIQQKTQEDMANELRKLASRGYKMGKILYKKREELYDRK